jgi:hypothetical protein
MFTLVAAFVHGNALGVVIEPVGFEKWVPDAERPELWTVRIGPLVPEAAIGAPYPKEDYQKVTDDLLQFCKEHNLDLHTEGKN